MKILNFENSKYISEFQKFQECFTTYIYTGYNINDVLNF